MILQIYCDNITEEHRITVSEVRTVQVYEKVRAYIDERGYPRGAVAEKAGISKATFQAILNGKRTMYADDLKAICLALNVSPEVFIEYRRTK